MSCVNNRPICESRYEAEKDIVVPLAIVRAASNTRRHSPTIVVVARAGKQRMLGACSAEIADLMAGGAAVCLADLRGTGETRPGGDDGPRSTGTQDLLHYGEIRSRK